MSKPEAKPLFLVKPGTIKPADIKRAERMCGVCIVECEDPNDARFLIPPPPADMEAQARVALKVINWIASERGVVDRGETARYFLKLLSDYPKPIQQIKAAA